jgi:hypothetical protein
VAGALESLKQAVCSQKFGSKLNLGISQRSLMLQPLDFRFNHFDSKDTFTHMVNISRKINPYKTKLIMFKALCGKIYHRWKKK